MPTTPPPPSYNNDAPPAYSLLPSAADLKAGALAVAQPQKTDYTFTVNVYGTNAQLQGANGSLGPAETWGNLSLGTKSPNGVIATAAYYKPPMTTGPNGQMQPGIQVDISASVVTVPDASIPQTSTHYQKTYDSLNAWTFDIIMANDGTENAYFNGTMTTSQGTYNWSGQYMAPETMTLQTTVPIPAPIGVNTNLLGTLMTITPYAFENEDSGIVKGDDAAQKRGDIIMQQLMMSALDATTQQNLLPNMTFVDSTSPYYGIVTANKDFLNRAGIHMLAEQLKTTPNVPSSITENIVAGRFQLFMNMMASPTAPTDPKQTDPVVAYGWSRTANAAQLKSLQQQYDNVIMRCYEEGWKLQCSLEWNLFLPQPAYWFKRLAQYLTSDEFLGPWVAKIPTRDQNPKATPIDQEILVWMHKLSLLKQATPPADQAGLDVVYVTNFLTGQAQQALAYNQIVDSEFLKQAQVLYQEIDAVQASNQFKQSVANRIEYSQDISGALLEQGTAILDQLLNNEGSDIAIESQAYWMYRSPPGAFPTNGRMTLDQVYEVWENKASFQAAASQTKGILETVAPNPTVWKRFGNGLAAVKKLATCALHVLAVGVMLYELVPSVSGVHLNTAEFGSDICALASEVLNIVGIAARKVLNYMWSKGRVYQRATEWFTDALKGDFESIGKRVANALAGSIGKIIRLIGIIGCVFSIISAYWDVQKANSMNPNDKTAFLVYSWATFGLGCVEGAALVGGMLAEIVGSVTIAGMCGPIGIAVAAIAIIVTVVYYFCFAPNPDADIETFLTNDAEPIGSYT